MTDAPSILLSVPEELLDAVADRVVARLLASNNRATVESDGRWLTTAEAAKYLGMSPNALHKLTAAREVPFVQDSPGGKMYFKRSRLDAWRGE